MLKRILTSLEVGLARLFGRVRMVYYRVRMRKVLRLLAFEGEFIGAACPHEVRIPLEAVRSLSAHERIMLDHALIDGARPYGSTLHECLRCYCLTRTTVKTNIIGY